MTRPRKPTCQNGTVFSMFNTLWAILALVAVSATGCSSEQSPPTAQSPTNDATVPTSTEAATTTAAATPPAGTDAEIAADPADGAPPVCFELAGSIALTELTAAFADIVSAETSDDAAARLVTTASELRTIGDGDNEFSTELIAAADALDQLASNGPSQEAFDDVSTTLDNLGTEVQSACQFELS